MEQTYVVVPVNDPQRNAAPQHEATDSDLLTAYVESRDSSAFELLLTRHGPMVMATCRRILRNDHDADDAFRPHFWFLHVKRGRFCLVRWWRIGSTGSPIGVR